MISFTNEVHTARCHGYYYDRFPDEASDWPDEYDVAQDEQELAITHKTHRQPQQAQQEGWDGSV